MSDGERSAPNDWAGVRHARASDDARIASLVPSLTETLFALGLGERVVARTGFCIHPKDAVRRVPKIGGTKDPDLDALRALHPTHLVVNVDENRREHVDAARAFVPHVIVTHPLAPDDNARLLRLLGAVFGRDAEADALARRSDAALSALRARSATLPSERVLYLIWKRPWMTVSSDTYIAATLAAAGWTVAAPGSDRRYPELPDDPAQWPRVDRVLLSTEPYAFRRRDADPIVRATGTATSLIDGEWTSWYGVRAIEGMERLAELRADLAAANG